MSQPRRPVHGGLWELWARSMAAGVLHLIPHDGVIATFVRDGVLTPAIKEAIRITCEASWAGPLNAENYGHRAVRWATLTVGSPESALHVQEYAARAHSADALAQVALFVGYDRSDGASVVVEALEVASTDELAADIAQMEEAYHAHGLGMLRMDVAQHDVWLTSETCRILGADMHVVADWLKDRVRALERAEGGRYGADL